MIQTFIVAALVMTLTCKFKKVKNVRIFNSKNLRMIIFSQKLNLYTQYSFMILDIDVVIIIQFESHFSRYTSSLVNVKWKNSQFVSSLSRPPEAMTLEWIQSSDP